MNRLRLLLIFIFITAGNIPLYSQNVRITSFPQTCQLYPRDVQDSSIVDISGYLRTPGYDSVNVSIEKNGLNWSTLTEPLNYVSGVAQFDFQPKIHAELANYTFRLSIDGNMIIEADSVVSGDVFFIQGQSNAEAYGDYPYRDRWVRTFGTASFNPDSCRADTVWGIAGANLGPLQYAHLHIGIWGERLGHLIVENYGVPVCIINGAKGGTTIAQHQRDASNPRNLNTIYGRLLYRMQESDLREHVRGIIWHQGEQNTFPYNWGEYASQFDSLYHDWMMDYPGVENVYLFQIRQSFYDEAQSQLREVQRTIPYEYNNVKIMSTLGIEAHDGLHFYADGYVEMAERIYPLIARDYYGSADTLNIAPPMILNVAYTSPTLDTIALEFDQEVFWPEDYQGYTMEDHIYLDGLWGVIHRGGVSQTNPNTVLLALNEPVEAQYLTYTPNQSWNHATPTQTYEGPLIKNERGIDALTFFRFPIENPFVPLSTLSSESETVQPSANDKQILSVYPNPFNNHSVVSFSLERYTHVRLTIYDITGREVQSLANGHLSPGEHEAVWNAEGFSSGIYFARLDNGKTQMTQKLLLIK